MSGPFHNALAAMHWYACESFEELAKLSDEKLLAAPGVGKATVKYIREQAARADADDKQRAAR